MSRAKDRTYLKNVFWPPAFGGIGASLQILDIQQYASGLRPTYRIWSGGKSRTAGKLGPATILNQNPIFEMDSNPLKQFRPAIIETGVNFFIVTNSSAILTWGCIDLDCLNESVIARREIEKMAHLQLSAIANAITPIY